MSLLDRPWPVDYTYRDVRAKIDFRWGSDDNPVPIGLSVSIDPPGMPVLASLEKRKYDSFDDAVARGKKMAEVDIDRVLGSDAEVPG